MIGNCSLRGSTSLTAISRQLLAPNTSTTSKLNLVLDGSERTTSLCLWIKSFSRVSSAQTIHHTQIITKQKHTQFIIKIHSVDYKKKLYNSSHKKITQIIKQNKIAPKSSQKIFKRKKIIAKKIIIIYKPLPKKSHQ